MTRAQLARTIALIVCLCAVLLSPGSAVANPPDHSGRPTVPAMTKTEPGTLLSRLAGTWEVRQRMWTGPDSDPVPLPAATAHRRLVRGSYVEEELEPAKGIQSAPFTRSATIGWNAVNQTYEYFSIDTRLPQMMAYPTATEQAGSVWFTLRAPFVAPTWGVDSDVPFTARLELRPGAQRQVVRLYLKRLSAEPTEEFVAFEYLYTRTH